MYCTECGKALNEAGICDACEKNKTKKIIVTREKKVMGFAISFPVFIDGEKLDNLGNGKSLEKVVSPGKHVVEFRCVEKTITQEVTLDKNDTVEITCKASMGLIAAIASITDIEYK
ncbi:MAG: hypothetical protein IKE10_01100 [Bacilli bacterium]|nr:hypothetical protein [Bacilli bacterium]